jgi:tetratricopeptide (TPR) repeat protein
VTKVKFLRVRLLLSVLCLVTAARAEDPGGAPSEQAADDARRADAKARYEQGVDAYKGGHFKDAVDLFLAADRLSPSAPLSFNIARAYEKLGDDSGALRWYRDYLRRAPNAANANEVATNVARFEARLAKKGVQQLTVLSAPSGATVSIDDANVGVTPGTFELTPGQHHVVLLLRGYSDSGSDVELAPDHAQDLTVSLAPAPSPAAAATREPGLTQTPQPAPANRSSPPPKSAENHASFGPWPWVVAGAGVAALGGALTFELLRESAENNAKHDATQIQYSRDLDTLQSRRTAARVLTGVGGALVVTGGVLLTLDLTRGRAPSAASLRFAPTAGGMLTTVGGAF